MSISRIERKRIGVVAARRKILAVLCGAAAAAGLTRVSDARAGQKVDRGQELANLVARQQIYDALMRFCGGVDRLDMDLVLSAYFPNARENHGEFNGPVEEFAKWLTARHQGHVYSSSHMITNHTVKFAGGVAYSESYVLVIERKDINGAPADLTATARYLDRFENRNGEWKIAQRLVVYDNSRIDPVSPALLHRKPNGVSGRQDRLDPAYSFFAQARGRTPEL